MSPQSIKGGSAPPAGGEREPGLRAILPECLGVLPLNMGNLRA